LVAFSFGPFELDSIDVVDKTLMSASEALPSDGRRSFFVPNMLRHQILEYVCELTSSIGPISIPYLAEMPMISDSSNNTTR